MGQGRKKKKKFANTFMKKAKYTSDKTNNDIDKIVLTKILALIVYI